MRIANHPILGALAEVELVKITVDGKELEARAGEPIAAALLAAGIKQFRKTTKNHEPRGIFCGIGQCTDCVMEVNGKANIRTCVTLVEEGMIVRTQDGLGKWELTDA